MAQGKGKGKTAWKKGPLPPDTWGWGGVTARGTGGGFFFADFCGDCVKLTDGTKIDAADVSYYNNSLTLPPEDSGATARANPAG